MTGPNTSTAVMQRRVEPHDSLDDFPTPPWGTRALITHVLLPIFKNMSRFKVKEPAANRGYMARALQEYFGRVFASDVHDYGAGYPVRDFLFPGADIPSAEFCITNPPFKLGSEFILKTFEDPAWLCTAVLVRSAFLEGNDRYESLYLPNPPTIYAQFVERIILTKGIVRDPAKLYWDDEAQKWRRPSTATSYCWLVWIKDEPPRPTMWIPPCRRQLERAGDYP